MADSLEVVLELADKVSGPAARAAAALAKIDAQAQKAQASAQAAADKYAANQSKQMDRIQRGLSKASAAADKQAERSAKSREKALTTEAAATRKLGLAQLAAAKMDTERTKQSGFVGGVKSALGLGGGADMASGAFLGNLAANAATSIISGFISGAERAVSLVMDGVKTAFREGGKAENLRLSYKLLLGAQGGKDALSDIGRFSGKTKYDDDKIAEMMRPLFNAGLKGTGARSAFAASGDLEAAGLGDASGFIEQFAKIQLKGGVTEKMLLSMGVSVKDFKEALAKETGAKNKETAFKKATEGKSDPQAIMNAIFTGIEKRQGGQIGTGTVAASKTMSARLDKLQDLPNQYLKKISESPAWDVLSDKLGGALEALDPDGPRGQKVVNALLGAFGRLATATANAFTPANIDAFAKAAGAAVSIAEKLLSVFVDIAKELAYYTGLAGDVVDASDHFTKIGGGDANKGAQQEMADQGDDMSRSRDRWNKIKQAENIGFFDDLMMSKEDHEALTQKYADQAGGVPPTPSSGGGGAPTGGLPVTNDFKGMQINIVAAPGADVKAMADQAGPHFQSALQGAAERSAQEGGGG